jgi:hypothetical protein
MAGQGNCGKSGLIGVLRRMPGWLRMKSRSADFWRAVGARRASSIPDEGHPLLPSMKFPESQIRRGLVAKMPPLTRLKGVRTRLFE